LPFDTLDLLEQERGVPVEVSRQQRLDWTPVRESIAAHGMRNSNTMAIAPTATIANISGCFPCIEPIYKNIYVKANISGEFTIVNRYLVDELSSLGLWNGDMLDQLKYFDGNLSQIPGIPEEMKAKYQEAFEIDPIHALRMTATRGKWIDQSQSHNVFMKGTSGKMLADIYMSAWKMGMKTTYYLRTLAATQIEKSTLDASKYGFTQKREYDSVAASPNESKEAQPKANEAVANRAVANRAGANRAGASTSKAKLPEASLAPSLGMSGAIVGAEAVAGFHPLMRSSGPAPQAPSPQASLPAERTIQQTIKPEPKLCRIGDPDCEACQ